MLIVINKIIEEVGNYLRNLMDRTDIMQKLNDKWQLSNTGYWNDKCIYESLKNWILDVKNNELILVDVVENRSAIMFVQTDTSKESFGSSKCSFNEHLSQLEITDI